MPPNSSHRPRIGMLTADSAPCVGGIGRHVESLSAGLRAAGHDVRVFDIRKLLSHRFGKNVLASLFMGRAVDRWIASERIDILHVHGGPGGALFIATRTETPVVITANHTYASQARMPGQDWKRVLVPWERAGYRTADRVVCISPDTRDELVDAYGIPAANVTAADCGFDVAPWAAADADVRAAPRCVFVGRPQARKGWDILQAAWPRIRAAVPDATLDVVGFEAEPMDGAAYKGKIGDPALRALVGSARLLLMPSRLEGFGLAAAEAVCAGTPVVACDVPGLRCTVEHGRTGVLSSAGGFADAAIALLRDAPRWEALHAGCRAARGRFDIGREVAAYEAAYAAVYSRP